MNKAKFEVTEKVWHVAYKWVTILKVRNHPIDKTLYFYRVFNETAAPWCREDELFFEEFEIPDSALQRPNLDSDVSKTLEMIRLEYKGDFRAFLDDIKSMKKQREDKFDSKEFNPDDKELYISN